MSWCDCQTPGVYSTACHRVHSRSWLSDLPGLLLSCFSFQHNPGGEWKSNFSVFLWCCEWILCFAVNHICKHLHTSITKSLRIFAVLHCTYLLYLLRGSGFAHFNLLFSCLLPSGLCQTLDYRWISSGPFQIQIFIVLKVIFQLVSTKDSLFRWPGRWHA